MPNAWIKMRVGLMTSPKVVRMASALKADTFRVVGGLLAAWCLFDGQTEDGFLDGYTTTVLDELVGFPGIGAAMVAVSWLQESDAGLSVPGFTEHNGKSAKLRIMETERKRVARLAAQMSASNADNGGDGKRAREDEDKKELKAPSAAPPPTPPDDLPDAPPKPKAKAAPPMADDDLPRPFHAIGYRTLPSGF